MKLIIITLIALWAPCSGSTESEFLLLGTRKDIAFLNAEGDVLRPLSYHFKDRNLVFMAVDIDSAENSELYKNQLSALNEIHGKLPALFFGTAILHSESLTYQQAESLIQRFQKKNPKKIRPPVVDTDEFTAEPASQKTARSSAGVFTTAIIITISAFLIHQSRKRLLRK